MQHRSTINPAYSRQISWTQYIAGGVVVVMTAVAGYSYGIIRTLTLRSLKQNAFLEARSGANEIDHWLATLKSQTEAIANTPTLQTVDWQTIEPYFLSELARVNGPFKLSLISNDGYLIANTSVGLNRKDLRHREYLQRVMQGQTFVSDAVVSPSTGITQILISTPIWAQSLSLDHSLDGPATIESDRPMLGIVNNAVTVDLVAEVVSQLAYGSGSYAFVLNSDGRAMVHPDTDRMSTQENPAISLLEDKNEALVTIVKKMVNQESGIELQHIDGQWQYVAYLPMQEADWSLALVIPRSNIEHHLRPLDLIALSIGVLFLSLVAALWSIQVAKQKKLREERAMTEAINQELEQRVQERTTELAQARNDLEDRVQARTAELEATMKNLKQTQLQMVQSEKMSALGQLVAGVAHEINNPVSFIHGNLTHAEDYIQELLEVIEQYQRSYPEPTPEIQEIIETVDLQFLQADFLKLLQSMRGGTERIRTIVKSLRNFSRLDEAVVKKVDVHEGIDSALVILQTRLRGQDWRPEIQIIKKYGLLPLIECYAGQLNQVFINILSNSIDALEDMWQKQPPQPPPSPPIYITIETVVEEQSVVIHIRDNGPGMDALTRERLFDPFFTTKPVGKGTGLGLSISYQIVTERHEGTLVCDSCLGAGATFTITLPIALSNTSVEKAMCNV